MNDGVDLYVNGHNYTESLFPGRRWAAYAHFRTDGSIVWVANWYEGDRVYDHTFVDRENYSAPLYGTDALVGYGGYRANERGEIAAHVVRKVGTSYYCDIWLGRRNVTEPILGSYPRDPSDLSSLALLEDGTLFWGGTSSATNYLWDWYRQDVNLSRDLLGENRHSPRHSGAFAVNSSGQYAFEGNGILTGGYWNLFVGRENFSARVLGPGPHEVWLGGINEQGSVAWCGWRPRERPDIYRDDEILSSFLGPNRFVQWNSPLISPRGNVAWMGGTGEGSDRDVYVNRSNVSADLLGTGRGARPLGFTGDGIPIWYGIGSAQPEGALFAGTVNLYREALDLSKVRPSEHWAEGNARGDVLWYFSDVQGGKKSYELWLSTLVPEPGSACAVAVGLAWLIHRRRQAG